MDERGIMNTWACHNNIADLGRYGFDLYIVVDLDDFADANSLDVVDVLKFMSYNWFKRPHGLRLKIEARGKKET